MVAPAVVSKYTWLAYQGVQVVLEKVTHLANCNWTDTCASNVQKKTV